MCCRSFSSRCTASSRSWSVALVDSSCRRRVSASSSAAWRDMNDALSLRSCASRASVWARSIIRRATPVRMVKRTFSFSTSTCSSFRSILSCRASSSACASLRPLSPPMTVPSISAAILARLSLRMSASCVSMVPCISSLYVRILASFVTSRSSRLLISSSFSISTSDLMRSSWSSAFSCACLSCRCRSPRSRRSSLPLSASSADTRTATVLDCSATSAASSARCSSARSARPRRLSSRNSAAASPSSWLLCSVSTSDRVSVSSTCRRVGTGTAAGRFRAADTERGFTTPGASSASSAHTRCTKALMSPTSVSSTSPLGTGWDSDTSHFACSTASSLLRSSPSSLCLSSIIAYSTHRTSPAAGEDTPDELSTTLASRSSTFSS
mmetsp:Transcript_17183/g.58754  ORF Transcript_17183/g.58754 Transcript_17183/m.58754 type:complete len:383 (-) Transcript_17183:422-1570(-)